MDALNASMPLIFNILLMVLMIFGIILLYKLITTVDRVNTILDDAYIKVKKLDNLFEIIDKSADTINAVTDKFTGAITSAILKIFKGKKRKEDENE